MDLCHGSWTEVERKCWEEGPKSLWASWSCLRRSSTETCKSFQRILRSSSWRDIFRDGCRSSGDSWLDKSFTVLTFKLIGAISSLNAWKKKTVIIMSSEKNITKVAFWTLLQKHDKISWEANHSCSVNNGGPDWARVSATKATSWRVSLRIADKLTWSVKREVTAMQTHVSGCVSFKVFMIRNSVWKMFATGLISSLDSIFKFLSHFLSSYGCLNIFSPDATTRFLQVST